MGEEKLGVSSAKKRGSGLAKLVVTADKSWSKQFERKWVSGVERACFVKRVEACDSNCSFSLLVWGASGLAI